MPARSGVGALAKAETSWRAPQGHDQTPGEFLIYFSIFWCAPGFAQKVLKRIIQNTSRKGPVFGNKALASPQMLTIPCVWVDSSGCVVLDAVHTISVEGRLRLKSIRRAWSHSLFLFVLAHVFACCRPCAHSRARPVSPGGRTSRAPRLQSIYPTISNQQPSPPPRLPRIRPPRPPSHIPKLWSMAMGAFRCALASFDWQSWCQ